MGRKGKDSDRENRGSNAPKNKDGAHRRSGQGRNSGKGNNGGRK